MNTLEVAVMNHLISKGWEKGKKEMGWGDNILLKGEGKSRKQANITYKKVSFYSPSKHLYTCTAVEVLDEENELLNYFIEN